MKCTSPADAWLLASFLLTVFVSEFGLFSVWLITNLAIFWGLRNVVYFLLLKNQVISAFDLLNSVH